MRIQTDYLVLGSGLAGLFFALKAAEHHSVSLVTKAGTWESNTRYAQGGIAAVVSAQDSFALHMRDTLAAGAGLCSPQVVELVVKEGPTVIQELLQIGTRFSRDTAGELSMGREGGHSRARVVRADDATGRELSRSLLAALQDRKNLRLYESHLALELIVDGRCWGAQVLDPRRGKVIQFAAPVTLLATGGAGQAYLHTTNPAVASGDGVAMAYRAEACVGNLEFMQFHPTMLYQPGGESFLITEALRGYGGVLVNRQGEPFMDRYHPMGSLATRDIVARAIVSELLQNGEACAYLDATDKDPEETRRRFPSIYRHCLQQGIDLTRQPIPVMPAAHYLCGGVRVDARGRTEIPGLYAAGEVALTGLHGANRLASNSLLEALVFSRLAFLNSLEGPPPPPPAALPAWEGPASGDAVAPQELEQHRQKLRRCMWENVGIHRSTAGLEQACLELGALVAEVEDLYRRQPLCPELVELRNLACTAQLMAHGAWMRRESRGVHFNADYPQRDDAHWQHDTLMRVVG